LHKYTHVLISACLILAIFCPALLWVGCATNPVSKQPEFVLITEEQEINIGREMNAKILKEFGEYPAGELQQYVETIGKRLADVSERTDLFFHFKVVNTSDINAFALPGGYVYITRGLLSYANSESELAGVLGHEIGHVNARHAVRQYTKAASYNIATGVASILVPDINQFGQVADVIFMAVSSGYSREYEREADCLGITYAEKAGYDPKAISTFLRTLELLDKVKGQKTYHSLFATHPRTEERVTLAESEAIGRSAPRSTKLIVGREQYLKQIDGVLFGSDPKQGVINGSTFQHPDLRIELTFPKGWNIENRPEAVLAKAPAREVHMQLRLENLNKKTTAADVARNLSRTLGFTETTGATTQINGLDAYVGTYAGKSQKLGNISARIAFIRIEDVAHYIIGYAQPQDFFAALSQFNATINSFRQISAAEAQAIKPTRIRLYTVKAGDTFAALCTALGRPADDVKTLTLLNAMEPNAALKPGTVIKVLRND
jgi:predicted Zn-dependent protease